MEVHECTACSWEPETRGFSEFKACLNYMTSKLAWATYQDLVSYNISKQNNLVASDDNLSCTHGWRLGRAGQTGFLLAILLPRSAGRVTIGNGRSFSRSSVLVS